MPIARPTPARPFLAPFHPELPTPSQAGDLKNSEAFFYRVCGPVSAVEAECAKVKGCVAFTYEVRRRRRTAAAGAGAGAKAPPSGAAPCHRVGQSGVG